MNAAKKSFVPFEDLDFPETLYKYRKWEGLHKRILTHKEVWFASPKSFEDKYDCKIPTRWDLLTYQDILDKYYNDISLNHYRREDILNRMEFAINRANDNLIGSPEFVKEQEEKHHKAFHERVGILSLTAHPEEYPMWEMYSDNHKGFCVGFDPKVMLKDLGGGGGAVCYYDELPIIYPSPKHSFEEQSFYQVYSTLKMWEFEKEYRTQIFKPHELTVNERTKTVPAKAFKELIFGAHMSSEIIKEIIKSLPVDLRQIKLKQATLTEGSVTILGLSLC